jgi:hypothetical protein
MTNYNSPAVIKFKEQLSKYGIAVREGVFGNVVMFKPGHEDQSIAHELFYRINGKCIKVTDILVKEGKKTRPGINIVPLTDNDFYKEVLAWTLIHFKIEKF